VIRQAISCDICGSEKRQTNHWFVAYLQCGELRVCGWNSRNRLRPGSKHLCGQTCVHKLVDEFMAKDLAVRGQTASVAKSETEFRASETDCSLTSGMEMEEFESSARLIPTPTPIQAPPTPIQASRPVVKTTVELVALPSRPRTEEPPLLVPGEPPSYTSCTWRVEAWKREREREMRASDHRAIPAVRRRAGS
jgi:hypothetical protein